MSTGLTSQTDAPAVVVLEDGRVYRGTGFGATGSTFGEGVFTTGTVSYTHLTLPTKRIV